MASGVQISARAGKAKSEGMTPTTVYEIVGELDGPAEDGAVGGEAALPEASS